MFFFRHGIFLFLSKPNTQVDIDLNDPEVGKAAVKIQAGFKNFMAAKKKKDPEPEEEKEPEEEEEPIEEKLVSFQLLLKYYFLLAFFLFIIV